MKDNTRTIDELISLYTFECELYDFYVEGITDKLIFENYNSYKKGKVKIVEIDTLDFTGIEFSDLDLKSNKNKLVALSRILVKNTITSNVHCLIDKDFDGILNTIESNQHLMRTDFSCIESYFLCKEIIQKFIDVGIRNFPHSTDSILKEIGTVLRGLFIIRLTKVKFDLNSNLLRIENNLSINKTTGKIIFNLDDYISKFILANNLKKDEEKILNFIKEINKKLDIDIRNTMNGHDFIEILFLYINKVKSSTGFRLETFERAFLLSLQPNHFEDYPLFKNFISA